MNELTPFKPNWASPLGDTMIRLMNRVNLDSLDLAKRLRMTVNEVRSLIAGVAPISSDTAENLSSILGGSPSYWLNRDADFRRSVERIPIERRYDSAWLRTFPFGELAKFGWLGGAKSEQERARQLLDFFGIQLSMQWQLRYPEASIASAFRTSYAFDTKHESVASWLRQGERLASTIDCADWNRDRFKKRLNEARVLTKNRYPQRFFPKLRQLCAECGVALVAAPTPSGCPASGATQFLTRSKALLMVSFRFKTDDQFWFSFFHEASHLVLHDIDAVFIDDNLNGGDSLEEQEANAFAKNILVPAERQQEMSRLSGQTSEVIRFSVRIGIAPGIVVGQMQKAGTLDYRYLNRLKRRYGNDEIRAVFNL